MEKHNRQILTGSANCFLFTHRHVLCFEAGGCVPSGRYVLYFQPSSGAPERVFFSSSFCSQQQNSLEDYVETAM